MRIRTGLKAAAILAVAATVALVASVKSMDSERVKRLLSERVVEATGRALTVGGPLKVKLGLVPRITLENVTLADAPWGGPAPMLSVERIEAEVALLPLLRREILVRRLRVIEPTMTLATGPAGHGNWEPDARPEAGPATAPFPRFDLAEIRIETARLLLRDGSHGGTTRVTFDLLRLLPDRNSGPLALQAAGDWDGTRFELGGLTGPLLPGKPLPVKLKGSIDGTVLVADGTVAEPLGPRGLDIRLNLQGDELGDALKAAGLAAGPVGPYKVAARLTDAAGPLALVEVEAVFGRRDTLLGSAKGEVGDLRRAAGLDLSLAVETESLAGLSRLTGFPLPPLGPLKLTGRLGRDHGGWRLADIKGALGRGDVGGDLLLTVAPRLRLEGRLASASLALADVRGRPAPADTRLFPAEPLPLAALAAMDAHLSLTVGRLALSPGHVDNASATLRLDRGRLALEPFEANAGGGTLRGGLTLEPAGTEAALALRLEGHGLDLGRLARDFAGTEAVQGGSTDVVVALAGRGGSIRDALAGAGGRVLATVGPGRLPGDTLECGVAHVVVKDGIGAVDKGIAMETRTMTMVGAGTIDLRTERLDINLAAWGRDGGALPGFPRLGGTLAAPSLDPGGQPATAQAATANPCRIALGLKQTKTRKGR